MFKQRNLLACLVLISGLLNLTFAAARGHTSEERNLNGVETNDFKNKDGKPNFTIKDLNKNLSLRVLQGDDEDKDEEGNNLSQISFTPESLNTICGLSKLASLLENSRNSDNGQAVFERSNQDVPKIRSVNHQFLRYTGKLLYGRGERKREANIMFEKELVCSNPEVTLVISTLDANKRRLNIGMETLEVTSKGFKLRVRTWHDTHIYRIFVDWVATCPAGSYDRFMTVG